MLCLVACRQMNEAHLLHLAEKQVNMNVDSVYALLVQIELSLIHISEPTRH